MRPRIFAAVATAALTLAGTGCESNVLPVDEAALVEALAAEIGGGDVSAPHRWFVEDRLLVSPDHYALLSSSDWYRSHTLSEEARRRLASHGYRTCRTGERWVCEEASEDSLSVTLSIGKATSGTDDCEHVPVWVGEVTRDKRPDAPFMAEWSAALSLACAETGEDGSVRIESITRYWIEP